MLSANTHSDSQSQTLSEIMDDETYNDIKETFGGSLPVPEDINALDDLGKESNTIKSADTFPFPFVGKKLKQQIEEEDDEPYYAAVYNDYLGCQLNFQVTFGESGGQDWLYSEASKKVYIKMEKVLPLRFTWEPATSGLFLRTELVFLLDEHKSDPVRRCYNHAANTYYINQTMDPERIKHVVHCVNHSSSIYEERNEHLSILTPLCTPEAGSQYVPMCFKFFCKNSCTSGMNRRATELVFTLENERHQILARRTMAIRICSCPKRDKQKDEAEFEDSMSVKRKIVLSSNKKICDTHIYKVELNVIGKENYLAVCKFAYDCMAGQAARTGQHELFKSCMDDIFTKLP